jgi:hypothetical protein
MLFLEELSAAARWKQCLDTLQDQFDIFRSSWASIFINGVINPSQILYNKIPHKAIAQGMQGSGLFFS